jgi:Flp pilus assembly protein TadB
MLDMTADGQFRDPAPPRRTWLDRTLGKIGGVALLIALAGAGLVVVALAILFVGLLLPVVIGAGLIAFVSLWWRMRRLRRTMGSGGPGTGPDGGPGAVRFVVLRR